MAEPVDVLVVGHVGRDLVLVVDEVPGPGAGTGVAERHELLGGAANQAVGARQMGWSAGIVGVVGDDVGADVVLGQARDDGLAIDGVVRRRGASTALFVDVVTADGERRLLEHVPDDVVLTADDVRGAARSIGSARAVLVQLQQPPDTVLATVDLVRGARPGPAGRALLALDGAADQSVLEVVLPVADVLRADATEAGRVVGRPLGSVDDVRTAARELVARGTRLVALSTGESDVVAWEGGEVVLPQLGTDPTDITGAGDAFVVGLVSAMLRGHDEETAAWWAAAAAALTVGTVGGRPDLDRQRVADLAARSRR